MTAVSGGLLLIYLFIITYVFPLQARFYNPVKRTLFNAFFMSVRHLFQTIGILATDLGIAGSHIFRAVLFPAVCHVIIPVWDAPHCLCKLVFLHCYFQEVHA